MAMFETWLKSDFQEDLTVEHLRGNFFSGDSLGNLVGVEVFDNGEPAPLSGSVVGYVIRADGSTVVVPGTLAGNRASIILPACAYNVYGIMSIVIKVGSVTVGACTVHVYRSTTDTLVDPEHVIPSIDLLIQMVEECEAAVAVKADKVTNATNDHLAALDSYGNLKDSGKYATDFLASTLKGSANGVAELGSDGKVPSSQLPSYVDDVLEYDSLSAFPATGETGKIYVAKDTNKTYRWSGTAYVEISPSLALGETSSTAYRGDRGKAAYDHATDAGRMTTAAQSGLYKVAVTDEGHVAGASPVQKSDITALGIPAQDTTYDSLPAESGGTDESLVTTGEKYTWNQKYDKPSGGIPASDIESGVIPDVSGKLDKPSTAGASGQVLTSDGQGGQSWQTPSSGVTDYDQLNNRPQIAGVTLTGDKSLSDLGIASEAELDDKLDEPATAGTNGQVLTSDGQGGATWQTPSGGTVTDVQEDGVSILSSGVANILTMTGAGASAAGTKGLVPAPAAGQQNLVLTGAGSWQVSPGAKLYSVSGTMTGTSLTISDDYITADMKCIMIEIGTPSAFDDKIHVLPANGSVTISCDSFSGSSTVKVTLQKVISDPTTATSTEFDVLNNRIGDLSTLTTTAKASAVAAINEVDDHIANVLSDYHTASGSNSYASWSCKWVKIGRICSFVFAFTPSTAISSSIGGIEVTGMPNPVTVDYLCVFPAALTERGWVAANTSGRYGGIKNISATNPEVRACGSFEANKGYSFAGTYVTV